MLNPDDFSKTTIADLVKDSLYPMWKKERREMLRLDRWHRNELTQGFNGDLPELKKGTDEYKVLQRISKTPWARLVVNATVDVLHIQGFVDGDGEPDPIWDVWQSNRMDWKQTPLFEGATALGRSYMSIEPGEDPLTGEVVPEMKVWPATQTLAYYVDPVNDEWPLYVMTGSRAHDANGEKFWRFWVWADEFKYLVDYKDDNATFIESKEHGSPVPPVVQFAPNIDLQGRATGEVEPYIDMVSRMNQTTLDRHIVERFGAWVVRWATGLEEPTAKEGQTDAEARQAAKLKLSIEDILVSSGSDTKFGTLDGTPMEPYIKAEEWQARNLAVVSQSTPSQFVGQVENLSADAISALNAPHRGKVDRHKGSFGEQAEQALRLAGFYLGRDIDPSGQVLWRTSESRSLSQLADALSKLVEGLGIPEESLWNMAAEALGRPQQDVESWIQKKAEQPDLAASLLDGAG